MRVINEEGAKPVKTWCMNPEAGALAQAMNLARTPFAFRHVALMPDTHQGYGMPIGGVLAARGVVIPNAVGVDIGCGMALARASCEPPEVEVLKKIVGNIRKVIPVGFSHHKTPQGGMPEEDGLEDLFVVRQEFESAKHQIGTLGGGNHFIELQIGDDGKLHVMIHSGSRNLGKKVADHYNKLAKHMNEKWSSSVPREWDLAFMPFDSEEGMEYSAEMDYCLRFAKANRDLMMWRVKEVVADALKCRFDLEVNIHHNYAALEHHFGEDVMVHRKGATRARDGEYGLIPGSQGTASYIVMGLGNPESFHSCSHGAGRRMGRKEAQRTLDLAAEKERLDRRGIIHAIRGKEDLDEAAGAYKDIDVVMSEQMDLVKLVTKLSPLAVVKG